MAARSSRKKTTAKKTARKKTAAKKTAAKKTTAKKTAAKKTPAKKPAAKKTTAKKTTAKKTAATKATTKKAAPKKKVAAKKTPAKKKAAPKKKAAASSAAGQDAEKKAGGAQTADGAAPAAPPVVERGFEGSDLEEPTKVERPRGPGPHAHPDSGLTKAQVRKLHAKLLGERAAVMAEIRKSVAGAVEDASPFAESIDQAQHETEQNFRLRLADKQRKLLNEIQIALDKMEEGEYGVCEGTEDPIGFPRLDVRPWARYSVEYKEMKDRRGL